MGNTSATMLWRLPQKTNSSGIAWTPESCGLGLKRFLTGTSKNAEVSLIPQKQATPQQVCILNVMKNLYIYHQVNDHLHSGKNLTNFSKKCWLFNHLLVNLNQFTLEEGLFSKHPFISHMQCCWAGEDRQLRMRQGTKKRKKKRQFNDNSILS